VILELVGESDEEDIALHRRHDVYTPPDSLDRPFVPAELRVLRDEPFDLLSDGPANLRSLDRGHSTQPLPNSPCE
jgi:hypothetical protein